MANKTLLHSTEYSVKTGKVPSIELIRMALAEKSLKHFVEYAWPVIEPSTEYVSGWHIDAICEHLQAVSDNQIKNLLINIPPRHCKSLLVSVFWPCWEWIARPELRWLYSSYAQDLSTRDSLKCRRLIQSLWYQSQWSDRFAITSDQNQKTRFENDKTGYRLATSVDGLTTGEGGDVIVCIPRGYYISTDCGEIDICRIVEERLLVRILTYNHELEKVEFKEIEEYESREVDGLIEIQLESGEKIECTSDHLIFVENQGYKKAVELNENDIVLYERQLERKAVKSVKYKPGKRKVYNIKIVDNHNYFVNGILTHNCDDAHNVKKVESQTIRESTILWWDESMSTRLNNPSTGHKVVVMHRTHERDLTGHILAGESKDSYVHLCLPARYEKKAVFDMGKKDPRTKENEPLWKSLYGEKVLNSLQRDMGSYAFAGQFQQRPAPRGGGMFKVDKLSIVDSFDRSRIVRSVRYWDKAGTQDGGCYTSGPLMHELKDGSFLVEHVVRGQWSAGIREAHIKMTEERDGIDVLTYIEQEGGSGGKDSAESTVMNLRGYRIQADRVTGSKEVRAEPFAAQVEISNVRLLKAPWNQAYINELESFPKGMYKDQVDSSAGAFNKLTLGRKSAGIWGKRE